MAVVFQKSSVMRDVPMHYCPGCTHGIAHRIVAECIEELGLKEKSIGIAPVGCAVFAYDYFDIDMMEAAHGRAPAVATGATSTLAGLDQFTLFAPNDRAFEVLAKDLGLLPRNYRFGRTIDEDMIFTKLLDGLGAETITQVLLYHVYAGGKATGADVLGGSRYTSLPMANGQTLGVAVLSKRLPWIVLKDKDGRFFNDYVVKSKIDQASQD